MNIKTYSEIIFLTKILLVGATISLGIIIFYGFYFMTHGPLMPAFFISERFDFIEDTNGGVIREMSIQEYDSTNNFIAAKSLYKNIDHSGNSRIYLFSGNQGYHTTGFGESLQLRRGDVYKVYIETLGFSDTLLLRP